jgi:glycosyltransferase involved in cell wall biosynthesis
MVPKCLLPLSSHWETAMNAKISPLRLAYVSMETPREGQASYTHIHELVSALVGEGVETELLVSGRGGASASGSLVGKAAGYVSLTLRGLSALRRTDALYVRSHPATVVLALAAKLAGIPTFQEVNGRPDDLGVTYPGLKPLGFLFRWLYRVQFKTAHHLFPVTDGLAAWLRDFAGHSRITVVPNAANTDHFCPNGAQANLEAPYVVFVGGLVAWHGIATMLKALSSPHWPKGVSLVVVGDGIERDRLTAAAGLPGLRWLGRRPYEEVPAILRGALAALCVIESPGSRSDTGVAPMKLYEALGCGVPVIVSDLPFQAELIRREQCGLVVAMADADALAAAVAELAADSAKSQALGARGAAFVQSSASWAHRARQVAAIIRPAAIATPP